MPSTLISSRTLCIALLVFSSIVCLTLLSSLSFRQYVHYPGFGYPLSHTSFCSPEAYAAGSWTRKHNPSPLTRKEGVLAVSGFEGCASSREVGWHLGTSWSDEDEFKKLQWRGNASSYEWTPGEGCGDYAKVEAEVLVRQLVEEGGWLILGDSISEGHFFSLSCMLYPYVRATPDYTIDPWSFDRAWPQNLYLNPSSSILSYLDLPEGFEVDTTPLVTFRRVDLLLGKSELEALRSSIYTSSDRPLFSDEQTWDLDPSTYLPQFLAPLPQGNYRTMIISTAGHWTTTLFSGFHNDTEEEGNGLRDLLPFFGEAMNLWVTKVIDALDKAKRMDEERTTHRQGKERQVVVRAYQHGHDSCHLDNVELAGPLEEYWGLPRNWYNWSWIRRFNDVFEAIVSQRGHPNIHFLSIDRPGLLRPDGHTQGDCLHLLTGAGILEGWSELILYICGAFGAKEDYSQAITINWRGGVTDPASAAHD